MANLKKIFTSGRMSKDADERVMPEGEYRHAENINVLNSETSENYGTVKNVLSNKKLTSFAFTGTVYNITPKPLVYEAKNRIYWFSKDDVGCYLLEYNVNNQVLSPVLVDTRPINTRVLNLNENFLITGIDILKTEDEDKELILWTDNNMQPCCVNIARAKTWSPNSFDEEDILLIKKPPCYPLQTIPTYSDDNSNNLLDKFLSFAYRYKYLDGEYSATSSFTYYKFYPKKSDLDFQKMINEGMVSQFNAIKLIFNTGDKRVTDIQLLVKQSNSNTIYLIENLNKEEKGYGNEEEKTFIFSNRKILIALPENELFRAYDNIPLKAKSQTLINNYIAYANYLEFYDIKDKVNYDVSLVSKDTSGEELLLENGGNNQKLKFAITNEYELKKDTSITFNFNLKEDTTVNQGNYQEELTFYLYKNFVDFLELAQDLEFIFFIEQVCSNNFNAKYSATPPDNSITTNATGFIIESYTTNSITIKAPVITYEIDNTPLTPDDSTFQTRSWFFDFINTNVTFNSIAVFSSLKSNRSYEVGIIYLDKYNRASTAQTNINNDIYINNELSTFQNKLKITLYNVAPKWATRYKFVIKQDKEHYNNIFVNVFYREGLFAWIKLEGENIDKVQKGDTLVVKSDSNGILQELVTTEVLAVETKENDFIEGNTNADSSDIIEEKGLYMKIKPSGFNMDFDGFTSRTFEGGQHLRYPSRSWTQPKFGEINQTTNAFEFYKIYPGTSVRIFIKFKARGSISYEETYDKRFVSSAEYNSVKEWFEAEVQNLGSFGQDFTWNGTSDIGSNISDGFGDADSFNQGSGWGWNDDGSEFFVVPHRKGKASRKITTTLKFEILFTEGIIVFETQQKLVEDNIFYESEETFDVVNGEHHGSVQYPIIQNQNNDPLVLAPAIIELDFFNCFVQGHGIESYKYKDKFNSNALSIDYRPTTVSIEPYKQIRRFADVTHSSEPYNESSNINGLNNFNLATANFKELDKQYGSIQLIHNRLGDILVIQEEKAGKILFGKQAIYTAEGEPVITNISEVLGQYQHYQGNNGIGLNPESFAQDNFRYYWFNSYFGTPIRLSADGTTDINNGMQTYFRNLAITFKNATKIGAFDSFNKLYTLSVGEEPVKLDRFNCGNVFQKTLTGENYSYVLNLNNQIGTVLLQYNISSGSVNIQTTFNGVTVLHEGLTATGIISVNRNTLDTNELIVDIQAVTINKIDISITNICPLPIPLDIVLVVLGDELDAGKTILNRFRKNTNNFLQYEDTFSEEPITKFETISGFEGQGLFPVNGDTITIQSFKGLQHTGKFLKTEECNRIKYLISNQVYNASNINDLIADSTNLVLTETVQGINQNTFSGSFIFNRSLLNEKMYLIWDYTNRKPIARNDSMTLKNGESIIINVLINDTTPQNSFVTIITHPVNGTAVVNLNNTITYTHNGGVATTDAIVYELSNGICSSQATINLSILATTPVVPCNGDALSGGQGVTEFVILLDKPLGGIVIIDFNAEGLPDKLEIIHNNIKKATSGMTITNEGPFDDLYGEPTVPTVSQTESVDQFIGANKGIIPNRDAMFLSETGITDITRTKQQLIWFVYTAADYNISNQVIIRVTGPSGTVWNFKRLCTDQTPIQL